MKKTFELTHEKIKYPRLIEKAKSDIRKYIKRERSKPLADGVHFLDFDCKFGQTQTDAHPIHLKEIDDYINTAEKKQWTSFYIEILGKPGYRVAQLKAERAKERAKQERANAPILLPKLKTFNTASGNQTEEHSE